jgi:hypothetical protein
MIHKYLLTYTATSPPIVGTANGTDPPAYTRTTKRKCRRDSYALPSIHLPPGLTLSSHDMYGLTYTHTFEFICKQHSIPHK